MSSSSTLRINVVGGGISGLSTALALRRAGHVVHIYERSALNNEIGAAIHIPPNATRALLAWGLDVERAKLVEVRTSFRAKADTLEKFHVGTSEAAVSHVYGAPWFFAHRVDLHDELRILATENEGTGFPVIIHVNSHVSRYDPYAPSITLADGSVITSDVVIGADGIHSTAIEAILGRSNPPVPSKDLYNFCYRFLIPAADIASDPETSFWNQDDDGKMKFFVSDMRRLISYPCRNNEIHNFVAMFHQVDSSLMRKEDWQASVDKARLLATFPDLHPRLKAVISKATDIKQWALLYREPLPTWTEGNMALVGDACHPMLPHQGQGGAQCIEDSVALGLVFCDAEKKNVRSRLQLYEEIRRPRASLMQIYSNAGQDEPALMHEEASRYIPLAQVPKTPEEFSAYNFGYDVVIDATNRLRQSNQSFEIPRSFFQKEPGRGVYPLETRYPTPLHENGTPMLVDEKPSEALAISQVEIMDVNA